MKRAALYARVSTDEQAKHGYSIDSQIKVIRDYAKKNNYQIINEYIDDGVSGQKGYKKRPALSRLMSDLDSIDVILFIRLDRYFRSVPLYYEAQEQLDKHHVQWRAILEDYETETASGILKVNLMLSINQAEAQRTSERIRTVFEDMKSKGMLCSGAVPFGLKLVDKKICINEEEAPIVRIAYQRYIDTRSARGTVRYMTANHNCMFSDKGLKCLLSNRRMVEYGVIDEDTYQRAAEIMKMRAPRQPLNQYTGKCRTYLFTGILFCSECGCVLKSTYNQVNSRTGYVCSRRNRFGPSGCKHQRNTNEIDIESFLLDRIVAECEKENYRINEINKRPAKDTAAIKSKMEKLTDLYMSDLIDRNEYERRYKSLRNDLESVPVARKTIDTSKIKSALTAYRMLDREHQSAFWHRILKRITIDNTNQIFFELQ